MVTQITWQQAKQLTLEYLNWRLQQTPYAQRTAPTIIFDFRGWSIPEMMAQVQADTYVGQRFVSYHIGSLGEYVIS